MEKSLLEISYDIPKWTRGLTGLTRTPVIDFEILGIFNFDFLKLLLPFQWSSGEILIYYYHSAVTNGEIWFLSSTTGKLLRKIKIDLNKTTVMLDNLPTRKSIAAGDKEISQIEVCSGRLFVRLKRKLFIYSLATCNSINIWDSGSYILFTFLLHFLY